MQGITLFTSSDTPTISLPSVDGWIVGRLFPKVSTEAVASLRSSEQLAISSTQGRHLLSNYWGAYLALWQDPGGIVSLLRDPGGMLPALLHVGEDWICCASDPDILSESGLLALAPCWDMLAHHLQYPTLPTADTCLDRVSAILPGELAVLEGADLLRDQIWAPARFHRCGPVAVASKETIDHLASSIDRCVEAWARDLQPALLELSGGLDSSIVAAALTRAGTTWHGLTIATVAADGDERSYARMVADAMAAPLIERPYSYSQASPLEPPTRTTPVPGAMTIQRGFDHIVSDEMERSGAASLFCGTGGDNIFCFLSSSAPVLDAWQAGGWSLARGALHNAARLADIPVSRVARQAAARWISGLYRNRRWRADTLFLRSDVRRSATTHPWLDLPRRVSQGLWGHIALVLRAHCVLDAHDRASRWSMVFPLLSQPVLESGFAIPSWHWIEGGRDRSVARDAFAGRLPAPILARRRKGHLSTTFAQAYERDRPALRELICGGLLHGAGLLDRRAIEDFLRDPVIHDVPDWFRILEIADAELWVRHVKRVGS